MISNGRIVKENAGLWSIAVYITDMNVTREFRVRGDMHVGGLMLKIADETDVTKDWSDHALWWPERNKWLTHTRSTLDQ
uniref:Kindlin-2 N-terminal domain-containing protein n=1 Tax=Romanomermis culicivorax TaxID=13658 RepID=A0A915JK29_ROMCU